MKHKKEKKKKKRRSPSTSSASSSEAFNEWVEKSPPPNTKVSKPSPEKPAQESSLGCSFLDLALSSSSSREKKEKVVPANEIQPIELPVGIYYPNRKQEPASCNEKTERAHDTFNRYNYTRIEKSNNRQFQKPTSDDEHDYKKDKYSRDRYRNDKYEMSERENGRKFQKASSCDNEDRETKYEHKRNDKYERSEKHSRSFHKPERSDEEYDSGRKVYDKSEKSRGRQYQKPNSSNDDYSSRNEDKYQRKDKYNRSEKGTNHFRKPNSSDDEDYNSHRKDRYFKIEKETSREQFLKPNSDSESETFRSDTHEKQNERQNNHKRRDVVLSRNDETSHTKYDKLEEKKAGQQPNTDESSSSKSSLNAQVTHDDVNKIAAKLIKAELMGNTELVTKLKVKVAAAKSQEVVIPRKTESRANIQEKNQVVVVTEQNMKDRRRRELLEKKKLAFLGDKDDRWVVEGKSFPNIGDEYEEEDDNTHKRKKQKTDYSQANAIQDHKRTAQVLNSCLYCQSSASKHHPIVIDQFSEHVYLALLDKEPLVPHHCMIVTSDHITSLRATDSDTYQSVRSLCEKLVSVFSQQGKTCVFFETVNNLKWNHCHVHCIPLNRDVGDLAPLYFQKSISDLEADSRHNKTLTKIERNKLCTSIPNEMGYFYVNFDWGKGFAHVIENKMSNTFAEEIIGGMLDLSPSQWRNPASLSYGAQMKLKLDFLNIYRR